MAAVNAVGFTSLLVAALLLHSMLWVALGSFAMALTSLVCFMAAASRLIGYRPAEQLADVLPSLSMAAAMCALTALTGQLPLAPLLLLILQVIVGIAVYALLAFIFQRGLIRELLGGVLKKLGKEADA